MNKARHFGYDARPSTAAGLLAAATGRIEFNPGPKAPDANGNSLALVGR